MREDPMRADNDGTRRRMVGKARPFQRVLLDKQEAAASLGMSVRHFQRHVHPRVRVVYSGQLTLYSPAELERWATDNASLGGRAA